MDKELLIKKLNGLLRSKYRVKELHRGVIFVGTDFAEANNVFQSMNQEGRYFLQEFIVTEAPRGYKNIYGSRYERWSILATRIVDITGKCVYQGI